VLVTGMVAGVAAPLAAISSVVVSEVTGGVTFVTGAISAGGMTGLVATLPEVLERPVRQLIERLPSDPGATLEETLNRQLDGQGGNAAAAMSGVLVATGSAAFQLVMMLIALFFFLVHGVACLGWVDHASPLKLGQTRELLGEFKRVSSAVIVSTLVTAGAQALVAVLGFLIARVPHPIFFGAVTFFCATIPAVGAGAVCVLAAALLLVTGHPYLAAFLAVWGVVVVGLVDNLVKPLLIRRGLAINAGVVFFSLIGGILAFGAVGLLLGPLAVALFLALLRMYHRDFSGKGPLPEWSANRSAGRRSSDAA
jgi:predicted PurR-regulated permease PerM